MKKKYRLVLLMLDYKLQNEGCLFIPLSNKNSDFDSFEDAEMELFAKLSEMPASHNLSKHEFSIIPVYTKD